MAIDATKIFSCNHQFVAMPLVGEAQYFQCLHCEHTRKELPHHANMRKALLFFPVPQPVEVQVKVG